MAQRSRAENDQHVLRFRGELRLSGRVRIVRAPIRSERLLLPKRPLLSKQLEQRNSAQPCAAVAQKIAPIQQPPSRVAKFWTAHLEKIDKLICVQQRPAKHRQSF